MRPVDDLDVPAHVLTVWMWLTLGLAVTSVVAISKLPPADSTTVSAELLARAPAPILPDIIPLP